MTINLPDDLRQFVHATVQSGRFVSHEEAITEAVRLLQRREEAEQARTLEGIRQGLEDMRLGRGKPADEVFAAIRRDLQIPRDA
jgi:putative addiction module CopG family antidote